MKGARNSVTTVCKMSIRKIDYWSVLASGGIALAVAAIQLLYAGSPWLLRMGIGVGAFSVSLLLIRPERNLIKGLMLAFALALSFWWPEARLGISMLQVTSVSVLSVVILALVSGITIALLSRRLSATERTLGRGENELAETRTQLEGAIRAAESAEAEIQKAAGQIESLESDVLNLRDQLEMLTQTLSAADESLLIELSKDLPASKIDAYLRGLIEAGTTTSTMVDHLDELVSRYTSVHKTFRRAELEAAKLEFLGELDRLNRFTGLTFWSIGNHENDHRAKFYGGVSERDLMTKFGEQYPMHLREFHAHLETVKRTWQQLVKIAMEMDTAFRWPD